jgi:hypothetical protein
MHTDIDSRKQATETAGLRNGTCHALSFAAQSLRDPVTPDKLCRHQQPASHE